MGFLSFSWWVGGMGRQAGEWRRSTWRLNFWATWCRWLGPSASLQIQPFPPNENLHKFLCTICKSPSCFYKTALPFFFFFWYIIILYQVIKVWKVGALDLTETLEKILVEREQTTHFSVSTWWLFSVQPRCWLGLGPSPNFTVWIEQQSFWES